jgi:hypothetical protein
MLPVVRSFSLRPIENGVLSSGAVVYLPWVFLISGRMRWDGDSGMDIPLSSCTTEALKGRKCRRSQSR